MGNVRATCKPSVVAGVTSEWSVHRHVGLFVRVGGSVWAGTGSGPYVCRHGNSMQRSVHPLQIDMVLVLWIDTVM